MSPKTVVTSCYCQFNKPSVIWVSGEGTHYMHGQLILWTDWLRIQVLHKEMIQLLAEIYENQSLIFKTRKPNKRNKQSYNTYRKTSATKVGLLLYLGKIKTDGLHILLGCLPREIRATPEAASQACTFETSSFSSWKLKNAGYIYEVYLRANITWSGYYTLTFFVV